MTLTRLLIHNLLGFRLLCGKELGKPAECIFCDNDACSQRSHAVGNEALSANLLDFSLVCAEHVLLSLSSFLEWEVHERLRILIQLPSRLLHNREFCLNRGKRIVTNAIRLLDIWGDVFVWFSEVREERLSELLVALRC